MTDNKALERADIIAALRCCGNTDTKRPDCEHCPLNGHMCVKRMLEGAADLLERDTEPPNDPLTLEELNTRREPVWCACDNFDGEGGYWCLCRYGEITPPSCRPFMAKERPSWVFYRRR